MKIRMLMLATIALLCSKTHAQETSATELLDVLAVPGNFTVDRSVLVSDGVVYTGSTKGDLRVFDQNTRDLLKTVHITDASIRGVEADRKFVYVVASDGFVYILRKGRLTLTKKIFIASNGIKSISVLRNSILVSTGQSEMRATDDRIYLSKLNDDEMVVEIDLRTFMIKRTVGSTSQSNVTVMFDREGNELARIKNPRDIFGNVTFVNLYVGNGVLIQTIPGCCGSGVYMYDENLTFKSYTYVQGANVVSVYGNQMFVGTEAGIVETWNITDVTAPTFTNRINLPEITGFTGPEDIEIRSQSISINKTSGLLFAVSSGGTGDGTLPTLFVFQIN